MAGKVTETLAMVNKVVKEALEEADRVRARCADEVYEKEQLQEQVAELQGDKERLEEEVDFLEHNRDVVRDENETLRATLELNEYWEQKAQEAYDRREIEDLEGELRDERINRQQVELENKFLLERQAELARELKEYRRIHGPIDF